MLVLDTESKRQRRPNIRLGEIGEISAALACGISGKMRKGLWDYDFNSLEDSKSLHIAGLSEQRSSAFTVSDPGPPSRFLIDMQHDRENNNPNSMKSISGYAKTDEIDLMISKMNFAGIVQKRSRLVVKGQRSKRCKRTVFGDPWSFGVILKGGAEDREKNERREVVASASTPVDLYCSIDNQNSAVSKETLGNDVVKSTLKIQTCGSPESNGFMSDSFGRCNNVEVSQSDVNSVGRWLEEVGFGRYAGIFEKHEVDEEALPLLTFEDLKEMGVVAAGPRRKLYSLIRQLRDSRGG